MSKRKETKFIFTKIKCNFSKIQGRKAPSFDDKNKKTNKDKFKIDFYLILRLSILTISLTLIRKRELFATVY